MFFKSKKIRATMRERMHGSGIDKQIVLFTRIKVPRKRRRQNQKRIRENAPKMFRFVSMVNQIESFTLVFKIRVMGNEIGKSSYKLRYYYFVKDLVMNPFSSVLPRGYCSTLPMLTYIWTLIYTAFIIPYSD